MAKHRATLSEVDERRLRLMTNLKNHSGKWLAADAAASLERLEADHGVITINSAGRTEAEQNELIHRYFVVGGPANQPPNLYAPARPASASRHVFGGGKAFDTPNIAHMLQYGPEYGWFQNFSYDPVHFEYDASRDQHAKAGAPIKHYTDKTLATRQNFLNVARGEKLKVDGQDGPATKAAVKRYQTFLKKYGYKGAIDGVWGAGTQAAHSSYYAKWQAAKKSISNEQNFLNQARGERLKVDGVLGDSTKSAIKRYQTFLRKNYGYSGALDGDWGKATQAAHSKYFADWKKNR